MLIFLHSDIHPEALAAVQCGVVLVGTRSVHMWFMALLRPMASVTWVNAKESKLKKAKIVREKLGGYIMASWQCEMHTCICYWFKVEAICWIWTVITALTFPAQTVINLALLFHLAIIILSAWRYELDGCSCYKKVIYVMVTWGS